MKCPFRVVKEYEYADDLKVEGRNILVLNREIEEFGECYKEECPHWKWNVANNGYYCAQARLVDDSEGGKCVGVDDDDIEV